ncbi:MAG: putative transporter [Patescibacteria group bacterium]
MIKAFFRSREWALYAYGGAAFLLASLYLQVQMSVAINEWYGGFYNLLQQAVKYKQNPEVGVTIFYQKLFSLDYIANGFGGAPSFSVIAIPYVILATATAYFTQRYGLWWREAITFNYIPQWRNVTHEIEGASQRIQEDANRFARIVESLGLQVVRALMTLIAFLPLLWYLGQFVESPIFAGSVAKFQDVRGIIDPSQVDGVRFVFIEGLNQKGQRLIEVTNNKYVPGLFVWATLVASLGGMVVSWFVGWKLPGLEYNNQVKEAAFRKELVFGEDNKRDYASVPTLTELFIGVRSNYKRLYMHYGYFNIWMNTYDQFMIIVPYLLVGPSLFTGAVLLGIVVQVSNAFAKVHNSFALFIHNWTTITEVRSIFMRLTEFQANLDKHKHQATS